MMKQFLEFVHHHWTLWLIFGVVLAWLIFEELKNKVSGIPRLNAQQVTLLINRESAMVVDLRSHNIFLQGHITGAVNIPRAEFDAGIDKLEAHKSRPVILVDEQEATMLPISIKLRKLGFTRLYLLAGGINKWKDAGMPLVKK